MGGGVVTHSRYAPDTIEPAGQWLKQAACVGHEDAMFPGSLDADIEAAKAICRGCPVMEQCKRWALDDRIPEGVWGGMSEADRRSYFRRRGIRLRNLDEDTKPDTGRTLQTLWDERTELVGGHMVWNAGTPVTFRGYCYTPQRIGFELDRGRRPTGILRRTCEMPGCVLPVHFVDQDERDARHMAAAS